MSESIYSRLSERILHWDYLPGHRLTEEGLCAEFAVSRSPVREALNTLFVHSAYARAINLEVEGWEFLLSLTGPAGEGLPHAIALDSIDADSLRIAGELGGSDLIGGRIGGGSGADTTSGFLYGLSALAGSPMPSQAL